MWVRSVGEHTGVYAVPELIEAAAYGAEMEDLLVAAENLYRNTRGSGGCWCCGLSVWRNGKPAVDVRIAIIAGDRSLVSLVTRLAHSWAATSSPTRRGTTSG